MTVALPPVTIPPEWTGTAAEWTALRFRAVTSAARGATTAAARGILAAEDRRAYRAACDAAELRRIEKRFANKG
jgi:hypothetical protein